MGQAGGQKIWRCCWLAFTWLYSMWNFSMHRNTSWVQQSFSVWNILHEFISGCFVGGPEWRRNYFDHQASAQGVETLFTEETEERGWISASRKGQLQIQVVGFSLLCMCLWHLPLWLHVWNDRPRVPLQSILKTFSKTLYLIELGWGEHPQHYQPSFFNFGAGLIK